MELRAPARRVTGGNEKPRRRARNNGNGNRGDDATGLFAKITSSSLRLATAPARLAAPVSALASLPGPGKLLFAASALILAVWLLALGHVSGVFPQFQDKAMQSFYRATAGAGFKVADVLITGRKETSPDDLRRALGVRTGDALFAFRPDMAKESVETLPWVRTATITRLFPDRILVKIEERTPLALWQHDKKLSVIDAEGIVLTNNAADVARFRALPLVVGKDAPQQAHKFLQMALAEPDIAQRFESAQIVSGRRWDINLKNGIKIRLPEENLGLALGKLGRLQQGDRLFDKNISVVDLRLPDRLVIKTADQKKNEDGTTEDVVTTSGKEAGQQPEKPI